MSNLKKKTWKCVLAVWFFTLLVTVAHVQPTQAAVKLNATSMNLCVGERTKLSLTGTTKKAKWKSSNSSVIKVSSTGSVVAKQAGSATVTATVSNKKYSCKFKVNKTFKVDQTSISIKNNADVMAYLSVNGAVNASVADKKICSVTFGQWDGDYMPLTIVPKKVGSTTIKFTNSVNGEYCTLNVKVTALPVIATFETPSVNTGASAFIVGENVMCYGFQLNRTAKNVKFKVYGENGAVVRTYSLGGLKANSRMTVLWDGLDESGSPVNGDYVYAVIADGTKTTGGSGKVYGSSPFGQGDGTESNPFMVSSMGELYLIREFNGAHFVQDAEIDFNYSAISPLFDDANPFTGTYDGKNGTTSNWMVNLYGFSSVFGAVATEGAIRNVSMRDCVLNTTGSLLAYSNYGTIDNCHVTGNIQCSGGTQAAMLVMYNKGQIRDCNAAGNITVVVSNVLVPMSLRAGGIALNNTGVIAQCTSSVKIQQQMMLNNYIPNGAYEIYTGGIVADNAAGAFVTQCTFTGGITTQYTLADSIKDMVGTEFGKSYSGFVAGSSQGIISRCVNAGIDVDLKAQGTGNEMIQQ